MTSDARPLEVLLVLLNGDVLGGLEKIIEHTVEASLGSRQVEFEVALLGHPTKTPKADLYASLTRTRATRTGLALIREIRRADVVHIHAPTMSMWSKVVVVLAWLLRKPTVLTIHLPSIPGEEWWQSPWLIGHGIPFLKHLGVTVLAPSNAAAECATARMKGKVPVRGLIQGIPEPLAECTDLVPNTRLAFVARLVDQKRPLLAVEAIAAARRTGLDVGLDVVGAGELFDQVAGRARELGLDDSTVTLHGYLPDPSAVIAASSALLMSSSGEGCPVVVMEAAALGRPVIVPAGIEGVEEILEGAHFSVADPDSADDYARVITDALSDPGRLREVGRLARERYEDGFSIEAAMERLIAVYDEVVTARTAGG